MLPDTSSCLPHESIDTSTSIASQQHHDLVAVRATSQHAPWQAPTVLAAEFADAVCHPLESSQLPSHTGRVHHESQTPLPTTYEAKSCVGLGASSSSTEPAGQSKQDDAKSAVGLDMHAVRAEAARVAAKFVSTDTSAEVVLRFDFMNSKDTRVS